jgi:hypothetical protein
MVRGIPKFWKESRPERAGTKENEFTPASEAILVATVCDFSLIRFWVILGLIQKVP